MATSVQQNVYKFLSSVGCTRVCISKDGVSKDFELKYANGWKSLIYLLCHINFLIKVTFVILLSYGAFEPVTEFFDWIAILLWFLIISMILTSERLFYRKHPFFEILCAGWSYQESLYQCLVDTGEEFQQQLRALTMSRVKLQSFIAVVGSAAMLFQYLAAPKYCVFTYSAIQEDTLPLYILFGAHELLFIFHGWQFYGGIIYVSSCFGAELTHCIKTLTDVLHSWSSNSGKRNRLVKFQHGSSAVEKQNANHVISVESRDQRTGNAIKWVNSLDDIMMEYKKLIIWSDRINDYASYNFLVIHGLAYMQMISDVFVMIQLLRMPETDVIGIIFFAEDAGVQNQAFV
ncbi:unnamed protein product [Orchesella dallaii]|uniref:Odorant receptor n=1 Tax=Orchesella dallaii TaxID=48710 RepID=A0ABP1PTL0_9HEXA